MLAREVLFHFCDSYPSVYEVVFLCSFIILVCISLMTSGVEYLFMCSLALSISSLEKCLLKYFAFYLIGLFVFLFL
jgi:hypothetical protein